MKCSKPNCNNEVELERIERRAKQGLTTKTCEACAKKYLRKLQRNAREQMMRDCGLVKVRGAVSGKVYWE